MIAMTMIKRWRLFLLCLLSLCCLSAQAENHKFTLVALSSLPYEKIYYKKGEKMEEIQLRNSRRSDSYVFRGEGPLQLFIDDSEQKFKLVGQAKPVVGANQVLYFLRASLQAKLPISIFGIDDSRSQFSAGSYRFINFINQNLTIEFDKKKFNLRPRASQVQRVNLSKEGSFTPFIVRDAQGKLLGGTRLFSHASNREMVVILPPKEGKRRLDIRYFSD